MFPILQAPSPTRSAAAWQAGARAGKARIVSRCRMDKGEFEEKIIKPLEAWSHLGEETNEMGTRLIGHVPHIAPKAYLHVVYAPSDSDEFAELDERLERLTPAQLKQFFEFANGIDIFSGWMHVEGFVRIKERQKCTLITIRPISLSRMYPAGLEACATML